MKASSPFESFQRNLSFLSPQAWLGIHHALRKQIPNSDYVFHMMSLWLKHILIPFLILTSVTCTPFNSSSTRFLTCGKRAALATFVSPMAISQTVEVLPSVKTIVDRLRLWKLFRKEAESDAIEALSSAISSNLALRTSSCDIYFPSETKSDGKQKAMLFIPGLCVDHTAYASIASRMASEGNIIVAVLSLEPFRLADEHFVDLKELRKCMQTVTNLWNDRNGSKNSSLDWSIGGHSYGAYAAMRLAPDLATYLKKSAIDKIKTVMWAAGNREEFMTDLSQRDDIDAIVLLGSNDSICSLNEDSKRYLQSCLPCYTCLEYIKGANHDNFASYHCQSDTIQISRLEQQKQVSRKTIGFLFDHSYHP